ncbi:MAG: signal peptidase II [Campylobacterota bacterium]|nr:signal peptidase II [Campylobacterota bacterium]
MIKNLLAMFLAALGAVIIDQSTKQLILDGYRYYGDCIDLILVYNKGVAFSMFAFLQEWLKWIQIAMLVAVFVYVIRLNRSYFSVPVGLLLGAGASNIYDRFAHGGVVDMVYWHCGFDFAVFNGADVIIDLAVVWIVILNYKKG